MKNSSLFHLGLVLIGIPACLSADTKASDKKCFSQKLNPSYPCCTGNEVVYTDESGDWGVENNSWCGISNGNDNDNDTCFSIELGYPCCTDNKVIYTDERGDWGKENHQWCGIGNGISKKEPEDSCFSIVQGYPCCETCHIDYTDESGDWGVEDDKWCGIKDSCKVVVNNAEDFNFNFSFLKLENFKKNMLYSPFSIKYALKMLQEGAANDTFDEINKLIGNTKLSKHISIDEVLSLANGLFIRDTFYKYINTNYINTLKENYDAEVVKDEFKNKTFNIIKNMLMDETVKDPYNVMLIINALAIDMEWKESFSFGNTNGYDFYLDNGEKMKTTMMSKTEKSTNLSYYIDDNISVVTSDLKKYDDIQFEFMAIMPKENLSSFIENFTEEQMDHINQNLNFSTTIEDGVVFRIPKFKFEYNLDLKEDLKRLGIKKAFNCSESDFSKMEDSPSPERKLCVSDALHKADIKFTEKGIKAAAVTVFVTKYVITSPNQTPRIPQLLIITFDKPFMFIIRDKETKDIWFTGTVYEPNKWEDEKEDYTPKYGY
ncbi:cellulosomal serpin precursor [Neocallimastix lanati (nom. inval.)]|nr:cellulosomal serpin precursor [Neocallimastix sp. JGI-2020a]